MLSNEITFERKIEIIKEDYLEEGKIKGEITGEIRICRKFGMPDNDILNELMTQFGLSSDEAKEALDNFK